MPLQNFISRQLPAISAAWLNAVDVIKFTILGDATTKAEARAALSSDVGVFAWQGTDSGAVNAAVVTPVGPVTSIQLVTGLQVTFAATTTNTGPSTLNFAGTGVKNIVNQLGNPLTGGELSKPATLQYTGTVWKIIAGSIPVTMARTAAEVTGGAVPQNYDYSPDSGGTLNVFRFISAAKVAAIQAGINTTDVSAEVQVANDYLEGRAANCILTLTVSAGGSGYTDGTYQCVAMTGGTGTNAKCKIVVAGGAITSVVPAGPVTNTVNAAGLGNYTVGDSLTPATDNTVTSPLYFPSGGSGAVITVATVSVASGKTAIGMPSGGKLFFPPGYYYFNNSAMRVGSFVEWQGNSQDSVQFIWNTAYAGVGIYMGPDESGLYGFVGYYTMGSVLESFTTNGTTNMTWHVLADGIQQGSNIRRLNLHGVTNGGVNIKDNKGGVFFKISDLEINGASVMPTSAGQPTGIGLTIEYGGTVEVNQVTVVGGGLASAANGIFLTGLSLVAGSVIISDFQAEEALTGIDIPAGFLAYAVIVDRALFTGTSFGVPKGIWMRSGHQAVASFRGITAGAGIIPVQNDNTGYAPNTGAANIIPSYINSSATFPSTHESIIRSGVNANLTYVSGGTMTPDVSQVDSTTINVTTVNAFTIADPVYNGSVMPALLRGKRLTIKIRNAGAGVMGAITWGTAYKMSAWTNPANNFNRSIEFEWDTATWNQINQTGVDIPN